VAACAAQANNQTVPDCAQACSGLAYSFSIYSVAVTKHLGLNPSQACPHAQLGVPFCCAARHGRDGRSLYEQGAAIHLLC